MTNHTPYEATAAFLADEIFDGMTDDERRNPEVIRAKIQEAMQDGILTGLALADDVHPEPLEMPGHFVGVEDAIHEIDTFHRGFLAGVAFRKEIKSNANRN